MEPEFDCVNGSPSGLVSWRGPSGVRLVPGRQLYIFVRDAEAEREEKTPIVLHLRAPNQRPVQTTTDLAGFWQRLYSQVRRELCRRYPKHSWPENALAPSP